MIDVKYSQRIYIVGNKKLCVQKNGDVYIPTLIDCFRGDKTAYGSKVFDSICGCQEFIDNEALINDYKRALIDNEVLF